MTRDPGPDADDTGPVRTEAPAPESLPPDTGPRADGESGLRAFMRALNVPRNGKIGVGVGLAFALAVFVFFVVVPGSYRSPLWYLALGFVLAVSTAGLVAFVLTLARAIRLSRSL